MTTGVAAATADAARTGQRDCFVGASLIATPTYAWNVA